MASLVASLTASGGAESPGFLNDLIKQLWPNMSVAIARMIGDIVEPMFGTMLPPPLNGLKFDKIDLGTVPMHISNVDVHETENSGIKLDVDLDWDGKCDIELSGKMIPKFGVEHVKLRGRFSILLCPLTNILPLIGAAQVAFINAPQLDLEFTDAAHIANLGVIDRAIRKVILCIISSMAVLPNRFLVKLDAANDWFKTYQHPLGVLRLTVGSGSNLGQDKEGKSFLKRLIHDVPDCFVKFKLSAEPEWRTATISNNRHPEWNETHDWLVTDHEQIIEADVQDDDSATTDDDIGIGAITVKKLLLDGGRHELSLTHKGQATEGKLAVRGEFYRFVPDATSITTASEAGVDKIVGLMSVLVASVRNLSGRRQDLKPSVRVTWGDSVWRTAIKADSPGFDIENPGYDHAFKIPIYAGMVPGPAVKFVLMDGEEEKGEAEISLDDVLGVPELAVQRDLDVGNGVTIKGGVWLRGTQLAQ